MPTMALCKRWQFISPPIEVGEFLLILVKYSKRLIDIPPAFNSVSILTSRCFKFGVEVIDKFFSFKLWLKSREFIVTPFDTFSRTANQCGNSIAVYCFSIRLPQKAKKRSRIMFWTRNFSNGVMPFHIAFSYFDFSSM